MNFTFNRQAAVEYAHRHAYAPNPLYPYKWVKEGEDCTSFVSQCWNWAGIPKTLEWYCDIENPDNTPSCWSAAPDFEYYMVTRGYCYLLPINRFFIDADLGDVIQFYNGVYWHHSGIITKITSGSTGKDLYYSAHSNPRLDRPLSEVYKNEFIRILHVYDEACW